MSRVPKLYAPKVAAEEDTGLGPGRGALIGSGIGAGLGGLGVGALLTAIVRAFSKAKLKPGPGGSFGFPIASPRFGDPISVGGALRAFPKEIGIGAGLGAGAGGLLGAGLGAGTGAIAQAVRSQKEAT